MNRDRDPSRHRTVPEAHIQIVKRLDDEAENWRWESRHDGYQPAEATVKRTSLTQEVMEGKVSGSILLKHPDSIANMEKGQCRLSCIIYYCPRQSRTWIISCTHGRLGIPLRQTQRKSTADSDTFKGTTFAARARAAELNSARAAAAAKEAMTSGGEGMLVV